MRCTSWAILLSNDKLSLNFSMSGSTFSLKRPPLRDGMSRSRQAAAREGTVANVP